MRIVGVKKLRPNTTAALIGIAGGILIGMSMLGLTGPGIALLGGLLLGVPLSSYIYLTLSLAELGRKLRITRVITGAPVEGYAIPIRVAIESRSPLVSGFIRVVDNPPTDIPILSKPVGGGFLVPQQRLETMYFAAPRIGSRRFAPLLLVYSDPLTMFDAIVEVEPEGDNIIYGIPSRQLLEREMKLLELEDPYTVPRARLVRREGTEIYSIREFVEGDEPRLIDWKATARLGKLYVKELRRETYIPVLFVIAMGPASLQGEPYQTPFERSIRLIAALAQDVIIRDGTVGLLIAGDRPLVEPPVKAAEGLSRIIRMLGTTPLPASKPMGVLRQVTDYLRRHSPGRTIIVVATDYEVLPEVWREMEVLAERKYTILYLVARPGELPRLLSHARAAQVAGESS